MPNLKTKTEKQKKLEDILAVVEGAIADIDNAVTQVHENPDFDPIGDNLGHLYNHARNALGSAKNVKTQLGHMVERLERDRIIPEPEPEPAPLEE